MRISLIKKLCFFIPVLYLSLNFVSCSSTKKIKYFQDIPDTGQLKTLKKIEYTEPTVRPGDALIVLIQTIDPLSANVLNSGNITSASPISPTGTGANLFSSTGGNNTLSQSTNGYFVDKNGNLDLPVIGTVKAAGYTTFQLKKIINDLAAKYYKDYTVSVRFANFKVTITGEVLKPGDYIMPDERETILDALAMAGDLTIFAKRENVLLIRENADGSKTPYRINLKSSDIMSSDAFYLRQNDFIYVEPSKAKSDATDASQTKYVAIAGALLSLLIVIATRAR